MATPARRRCPRRSARSLGPACRLGGNRPLLPEAARPVLFPKARGLELAELEDARRARRGAVSPRPPETPAQGSLSVGVYLTDSRLDVLALGFEQPLDLPAADADAGDVPQDIRRALVGKVGAEIQHLLAHGGGVLRALGEADPLVERPADRAARRAAVAGATHRQRPEHGDDPAHRSAAASHRRLAAPAEDRGGEQRLLDLAERRPQCPYQRLPRLAPHLALEVVERRGLQIQRDPEGYLDGKGKGGRHDRRRL